MRYWSFGYPDENGNDVVETWSEADIREKYWPHWYDLMCKKFGKDHVDAYYSFEDCVVDWMNVHRAWESK